MTSRAFKTSSTLSLRPPRPSITFTSSNSSTHSQAQVQDFSVSPSPRSAASNTGGEAEDYWSHGSGLALGLGAVSWSSPGNTPLPSPGKKDLNLIEAQRIGRSRPIAIELPARRSSGAVCTPPEPLSARGDFPGGYFPFHEDITRSYKPHPFHPESSSKIASSLRTQHRPDPDSSATSSPQYTPLGHAIQDLPLPVFRLPPASDSLSMNSSTNSMNLNTPPAPLGKYHPSHYKNISAKSSTTNSSTAIPKAVSKLETGNEGTVNRPNHTRQTSDIRRKLQQYQREMVEQAALAGKIAIDRPRPRSPRLAPLLGSPGPVTPMVLEESGGYLVAGLKGTKPTGNVKSPLVSPGRDGMGAFSPNGEASVLHDATEMVRRMIREEQERDMEHRANTVA